jgi:hypothetical protein
VNSPCITDPEVLILKNSTLSDVIKNVLGPTSTLAVILPVVILDRFKPTTLPASIYDAVTAFWAQEAVPNKEPVMPWVAVIEPETTSEPNISALPVNGNMDPVEAAGVP